MLDEKQVTQVLEQVGHEPAEVLALLGEVLEELQRAGRVLVDHEVAEPEQRLLLDGAEELENGLDRDLVAGGRRQLVECRLRVAIRASSASRDQCERGVGRLDALGVGDAPQLPDQVREPRAREDERLTPRPDGREHLRDVGGAEDEDEVGRRLLDQLQERVEGGIRQLVRLVEDVDLVAALDRLEHHALADLPDVVDPALRGGVHLDHVQGGPVRDRDARVAGAVGGRRRPLSAVERLREDPRERCLPGPARPGEEVRLPDLLGLDRIPKRAHDGLLADDLVERLRAIFAIERGQESEPPIRSDSAEQRALPVASLTDIEKESRCDSKCPATHPLSWARTEPVQPGAGSSQAVRGTCEELLSAASSRT